MDLNEYINNLIVVEELEQRIAPDGGETVLPLGSSSSFMDRGRS